MLFYMVTIYLGITTISQIYKNSTLSLAYTIMSFSWLIHVDSLEGPNFQVRSSETAGFSLKNHLFMEPSFQWYQPSLDSWGKVTGHFFPQRTCDKKKHTNQTKPATKACFGTLPIPSMYEIFTYIWLIFMVNVVKYTIHGWYVLVWTSPPWRKTPCFGRDYAVRKDYCSKLPFDLWGWHCMTSI